MIDIVLFHDSKVISVIFPKSPPTPALLIATSNLPYFSIMKSIKFLTISKFDTSILKKTAFPLFLIISETVSKPLVSFMSETIIVPPSFEKANAAAFPIPDPLPVIKTILSLYLMFFC